ncbi:MAG: DUF58 domain-containing protein [Gammaproteobacteria bacterium]|nr:DUF58 domain-containing protein [Gammaproteobacteria bacterium]
MNRINQYIARKIKPVETMTLTHRKIYILPTKEGYYFALTIILMVLAAINFSNNLIYLFTFFLIAIALLSMFYTQFNLLGVKIHSQHATPVFCGEDMNVPIVIQQTLQKHKQSMAVQIKINDFSHQINYVDSAHLHFFQLKTTQRGYLDIPMVTISSTFPFGLFRAWSLVKLESKNLVYPQPLNYDSDLMGQSNSQSQREGTQKGDDEFFGLSQYIQGSSLKKVHWKMVAKEQGMYLKDFVEGGRALKQWFDIRDFPGHIPFEKKLNFLCYLIQQANLQSMTYGLKLYHDQTVLGTGQLHYQHCLSLLALVET